MKTVLLGGAAIIGVFLTVAATHPVADKESFQAMLTGSSEAPPIVTSAEGTAKLTVNGDTVSYSITAKGLMGVVAAHIHIGAMGKNGAPAVTLYEGPKKDIKNGELTHGTFTAADLHGITLAELVSDMKKGDAYVNVHTSAHPTGELRGQITPAEEMKTSSY